MSGRKKISKIVSAPLEQPAKRGRPATGRLRKDAIEVTLTDAERVAIEAAAATAGEKPGVWIRRLALAAAGYRADS
jgi:hypothetical protein